MIRWSLLGFPVAVEPWFWILTAYLCGAFDTSTPLKESWPYVLAKMAMVTVSILIHEFGHALVARRYGASPNIVLHGFGGLAWWEGPGPAPGAQRIAVALAGPGAGFALAAVLFLTSFQPAIWNLNPVLREALEVGLWINIYWNLLNLLPIYPLDGGQVVAQFFGASGQQIVLWFSIVAGGALSIFFFSIGATLGGFVFLLLTLSNFAATGQK